MTPTEKMTLANIILTGVNILITAGFAFYNYKHSRKKDLQETLYKAKFESYKDFIDQAIKCYIKLMPLDNPMNKLDVTGLNNIELTKLFEKECLYLYNHSNDLMTSVHKTLLFWPNDITNKAHLLSINCQNLITQSKQFDIEKLSTLHDDIFYLIVELSSLFRKDLGIDIIDKTLYDRIRATKNIKQFIQTKTNKA